MPPGQHHVIPSPRPHSIHPGEQSLSLRSCFKTGSFFEDSAEAPKAKETKHSKMSALYIILEFDAIDCMVKLPDFLLFSSMTGNCCLIWQLYIEFFMIRHIETRVLNSKEVLFRYKEMGCTSLATEIVLILFYIQYSNS